MKTTSLYFIPILSGKEYFQILINPDGDKNTIIPKIPMDMELTNQQIMEFITSWFEENLALKIRVIGTEPLEVDKSDKSQNEATYYFGFISVQHSDEKINDMNFEWVHPRYAYRQTKKLGLDDILEHALNWAASHDYNIEMLSNNLDKLR